MRAATLTYQSTDFPCDPGAVAPSDVYKAHVVQGLLP